MKKIAALSVVACLVMVACSKDSIGTKPQITFESYSPTELNLKDNPEAGLQVFFRVQDGDGDIENAFWVQTVFDNDPSAPDSLSFDRRQMPKLDNHAGGKVDAEVILTLDNVSISPPLDPRPTDSLHFRIYIEDNAGNKSDTITTPKMLVIKG